MVPLWCGVVRQAGQVRARRGVVSCGRVRLGEVGLVTAGVARSG